MLCGPLPLLQTPPLTFFLLALPRPSLLLPTTVHPVESSLYYSAALIPVMMGAHPIIFLLFKFDLTMAALVGHDGHAFPGAGSQPHWLHHNNFEW